MRNMVNVIRSTSLVSFFVSFVCFKEVVIGIYGNGLKWGHEFYVYSYPLAVSVKGRDEGRAALQLYTGQRLASARDLWDVVK